MIVRTILRFAALAGLLGLACADDTVSGKDSGIVDARRDLAVLDGGADARLDRPRADLARSDAPGIESGLLDQRPDSPLSPDGPAPDAKKPDASIPDLAKSDSAKPDSAKPDLLPLDQLVPDQDTCSGVVCDDQRLCTNDTCSAGVCSFKLLAGYCLIGGQCIQNGAPNPASPACQICDSQVSTSGWTNHNEGGACNDGQACSHTDVCKKGVCAGLSYSCDDALTCTVDTCTGLPPTLQGCTHVLSAAHCLLDGACYADGQAHPQVPFFKCASAASTTAWTLAGTVTTLAGTTLGYHDNCLPAVAQFNQPAAVALDGGKVYVGDLANYRVRQIANNWVSTLVGTGSSGSTDGPAATAQVSLVYGLATSGSVVYISDHNNHRIRKLEAGSVATLTGSTSGAVDGALASATFNYPMGITTDAAGKIYVADAGNHRIRVVDPAALLPADQVKTLAGSSSGLTEGPAASAQFNLPIDVAVGSGGQVFVLDSLNHRVRLIDQGQVSTYAGSSIGFQNGPLASARFNEPRGMVRSAGGVLYVADSKNQRIRMIWNGTVYTLAGDGTSASVDGPLATARFAGPQDLAVDSAGNLYLAERYGHHLRMIIP
jgi:hypothetical protein